MEVDFGCVYWKGIVPQCEFLLAVELDEECGVTVDVSFIEFISFRALRKMTLVEEPLLTSILLIWQLAMSSEMASASW